MQTILAMIAASVCVYTQTDAAIRRKHTQHSKQQFGTRGLSGRAPAP